MGILVCHYPEEDRLDITVEEKLDLTLTTGILDACAYVDESLMTCVVDCSRVERVFDSGMALLMILFEKLKRFGVRLVFIGEIAGLEEMQASVS